MEDNALESLFVAKQICMAKISDLNGCDLSSKAISLGIRAIKLNMASSYLETATGPVKELNTDAKFIKEATNINNGRVYKAACALALKFTEKAAIELIRSYEDLRQKYKIMSNKPQYQLVIEKIQAGSKLNTEEMELRDMEAAFNELTNVYDTMLNLTKILHYANKLSSKCHFSGLKNFKIDVDNLINEMKESRDDPNLIPESSQKLQKIYLKLQESYLNLKANEQKRVIDEISLVYSAVNHMLSDLEYQTFPHKFSNFKPDLTLKYENRILH